MDIDHRFIGSVPFQDLQHLRISFFESSTPNKAATAAAAAIAELVNKNQELKVFEINFHVATGMPTNALFDVIKTNSSITKLAANYFDYAVPVHSEDLWRLAIEHPALIELDLLGYRLTAEGVIALLRQLNSLKAFQFLMHHSEYTQLMSQLDGEEWNETSYAILNCTCVALSR